MAGLPVICRFELATGQNGVKGSVRLYAEVGPMNDRSARAALIRDIEDASQSRALKNVSFRRDAKEKRFSRFFRNNIIQVEDVRDAAEIANAIKALIKRFENEFRVVADVFQNTLGWEEVKVR